VTGASCDGWITCGSTGTTGSVGTGCAAGVATGIGMTGEGVTGWSPSVNFFAFGAGGAVLPSVCE
jgi:hypothetical protein